MLFVRAIHELPLQKYFRVMMGKKRDLKQIDAIAKEFDMSPPVRKSFGKFIEKQKANGDIGTLNAKGDFTWEELQHKAEEFLKTF
jgi:hypothetical protein